MQLVLGGCSELRYRPPRPPPPDAAHTRPPLAVPVPLLQWTGPNWNSKVTCGVACGFYIEVSNLKQPPAGPVWVRATASPKDHRLVGARWRGSRRALASARPLACSCRPLPPPQQQQRSQPASSSAGCRPQQAP